MPPKQIGQWKVGALIGHGTFAKVYEATNAQGERAVVKSTPHGEHPETPRLNLFITREAATHMHVDSHTAIPKVHDVVVCEAATHIVMERCEGIELFEYLKQHEGSRLPEDEILIIMRQLLEALDHMHRRCVMHRDIKLDNLIYDPATMRLRVIDFNLSTFFLPHLPLSEPVGCIHYASPSLLLAAQGHTYSADRGAADLWAAGVACYGLAAGYFPFRSTQAKKLHREILTTSPARLEWPDSTSAELRRFVGKMIDPFRPASAAEMLADPFLNPAAQPSMLLSDAIPVVEESRGKWVPDTTGVTDKMARVGDWAVQEKAVGKYVRTRVEQRRKEAQARREGDGLAHSRLAESGLEHPAPRGWASLKRARTNSAVVSELAPERQSDEIPRRTMSTSPDATLNDHATGKRSLLRLAKSVLPFGPSRSTTSSPSGLSEDPHRSHPHTRMSLSHSATDSHAESDTDTLHTDTVQSGSSESHHMVAVLRGLARWKVRHGSGSSEGTAHDEHEEGHQAQTKKWRWGLVRA